MSSHHDQSPKRAVVLEAALDVLREDGIDSLTVRAVAARAGQSTTGVYTHFGGKQGLLDALYISGFGDFEATVATQAVSSVSAADLLARFRRYREWARAHPTLYLLMFASRAAGFVPGEEAGLKGLESLGSLERDVASHLESAGSEGDARAVARSLWAACHGCVVLELAGPADAFGDGDAILETTLRAILDAATR